MINFSTPPHWADTVMAIVSLITLFAVVLAAIQILYVNRQMHRELEVQYLLRFWQLMDKRSEKMRLGNGLEESDRLVLLDYFSLSDDQIALRALGRVTDHTWSFWSHDIRNFCMSRYVKPVFNEYKSNYKYLSRLMVNSSYDPAVTKYGKLKRMWRGL